MFRPKYLFFLILVLVGFLLFSCKEIDGNSGYPIDANSVNNSPSKIELIDCSIDSIALKRIVNSIFNEENILPTNYIDSLKQLDFTKDKLYKWIAILSQPVSIDTTMLIEISGILPSGLDSSSFSNKLVLSHVYYHLGKSFYKKRNYQKSSKAFKEAVRLIENQSEDQYCRLELNYLEDLIFTKYWYEQDKLGAIPFLKKQELLFVGSEGMDKYKYKNYYTQASFYKDIKEYKQALNYINLNIQNIQESIPIDTLKWLSSLGIKANIYSMSKKEQEAIETYLMIIKMGDGKKINSNRQFTNYLGLLNNYANKGELKKGQKYMNRLMEMAGVNEEHIALVWKMKGLYASKMGEGRHAIDYYKKALLHFSHATLRNKRDFMETNYLLSNICFEEGEIDQAIKYGLVPIQKFIHKEEVDIELISKEPNGVRYLGNLGKYFGGRYKASSNIDDDIKAMKYYNHLIELFDYFAFNDLEDDIIVNQKYFNGYILELFQHLFWKYENNNNPSLINDMISIMSDTKAQGIIRNRFGKNHAPQLSPLYDKLISNKMELEKLDYQLVRQLISDNEAITKEKEILDRRYKIKKKIQEQNPKEHDTALKENLFERWTKYATSHKSILIDFYIPDIDSLKVGYVFVSDGVRSDIKEIVEVDCFIALTTSVVESLRGGRTSNDFNDDVILYREVMKYLNGFNLNEKENLIIIQDHEIRKLPFGVLKDDSGKFLIEKIPVTYAFSLKSLMNKNDKKRDEGKVLVFAHSDQSTIFEKNDIKLPELVGSYKEKKLIDDIFGNKSKSFSGKESTKSNFLNYAADYPIIHLALHGMADTSSRHLSHLFFRDKDTIEGLFPHELMDLGIAPELVFLSACQSGYGKNYNHEGIYSIARAFYTVGCNQVISSLWDLDDNAGSMIVKYFYNYLYDHPDTDFNMCLQQAKIRYLKENTFHQVSPNEWGSLVIYF